jgi:hydroxyethylthiazole kinase-like uncharacterized protein yjeF
MRELERTSTKDYRIPGRLLMENAGRAVADEVLHSLRAMRVGQAVRGGLADGDGETIPPPRSVEELDAWKEQLKRVSGPVAVLCGPGNNGGDGFVIARTLANQGVTVVCWAVGDSASFASSGDAAENAGALTALGVPIGRCQSETDLDALEREVGRCQVVVDALFGIGLNRKLEGLFAAVIDRVNLMDMACVAVDIPSGLDADSGAVHGTAILADLTVTFGAAKHGMYKGHGPDHCGRVAVAEIGFPRSLIERALS